MCGIAGYVGKRRVAPLLVDSLKRLEYRGYDSCGIATLDGGKVWIKKDMGKIDDVDGKMDLKNLPGNIGFGHTRWATHGKVSKRNSHPQTDCKDRIAVIHNGIIENFSELKKRLKRKGHRFRSETDTEVIAHLIEDNLRSGLDLEEAVRKSMNSLKGRSAIIVAERGFPGLIAARTGSPLILGVGRDEYFIASDVPAFLNHTRKVMYLDDGEMVVVEGEPRFRNLTDGKGIEKRVITIDWDAKQAEKGEHEHYMIKEILEQKETIMKAINQDEREIRRVANEINKAFGVFLTGCGTAGKVCQTGEYVFSNVANKHVNYVVSSEFPNYRNFLTKKTLLITVSQSGETADVLEAVKAAKEKGVKVISLVNVKGSTLDRVSDITFLIKAGPEKAVASTKATTAQLAILYLLAYACAGKLNEGKKLLLETASKINDMLNPRYEEYIKKLAKKICREKNVYIIGKALNYPMALEGAIKIMEVSYIHAQGFAGGELKHGPIALIEKGSPCIVLTANDGMNNIIGNAMEVRARGGFIIGVGPKRNEVFDYWLKTPDVGLASPIVNIIPVQLLAYHLGVLRGCDIDQPRNLAKSVTVE
ncbi:MAG: glutamine--fructose-6-phosphate transaminase (isomerizing) [Candidatus Aenigmarchaeota archaeon]|nr:glutamine--fructose-6-phosphate transaminase (isomerizing) [Candidatus Aenigmarchaeota archaeon]NIP40143.1 glutamine--fructose-6-phosphate transaminase (isomerizing) [Candidatus Aenigmarchaeota archaeon]NIQ18220.1 glutamine--fructose-6-phosphate transaminase (isomerizing) [Candidatus Aenigmarchaeota archaeon]NIS72977.1 glutamine--fructose-6-phosphate transaminase (isomerizing) [Candidatus Aenigmarchaeota archaeon]